MKEGSPGPMTRKQTRRSSCKDLSSSRATRTPGLLTFKVIFIKNKISKWFQIAVLKLKVKVRHMCSKEALCDIFFIRASVNMSESDRMT